jgi:hypothetical protein
MLINQEHALTQDGHPDENWANNCGETCDSMILLWSKNVVIEPDTIKDAIMGQGTVGYGYVGPLSGYLNTHAITTQYEGIPDADRAGRMADSWLHMGHPVIVLLYSDRAARTGGHFVLLVGTNDDGSRVVANPWGGWFETLSPAAWAQAYNGWLIHAACGPFKAPVSKPALAKPGKHLITTQMMARSAPDLNAVVKPVQMLRKGAVLDDTGKQTSHWVQVVAGGHPVWAWLGNTKAA